MELRPTLGDFMSLKHLEIDISGLYTFFLPTEHWIIFSVFVILQYIHSTSICEMGSEEWGDEPILNLLWTQRAKSNSRLVGVKCVLILISEAIHHFFRENWCYLCLPVGGWHEIRTSLWINYIGRQDYAGTLISSSLFPGGSYTSTRG